MDSNQYSYAGYTEQLQPYQAYTPPRHPEHTLKHSVSNEYNSSGNRASYIQPYYSAPSPTPFASEPPPAYVAELPAALPEAPPTTTSPHQLNQDQLLAHKLQNMEIAEARRRSSSNVSHRPSHHSLFDAASSRTQPLQNQLEPTPRLSARPHSASVSSIPFYGPQSFGPPPASFETNDGRMLMAHGTGADNTNQVPPTPLTQSLPEVVIGPRSVSSTGLESIPSAGLEHVSSAGLEYLPPAGLEPVSSAGHEYTSNTTSLPGSIPPPMDPVSLASYLEIHREVPYPPQWVLPPVIETLYAKSVRAPKATDWLDVPLSREWRKIRSSQHAVTPTNPTYSFAFKAKGGSLRDAKFSWTMFPENWSYNLRLDNTLGMRKTELLTPPKGHSLLTTYIQAHNYDSLRFIGPDGCVYLWVAHAPLSSTNGARYDTLRHALFMAPAGCDPLYGEIIADHAYWDGFIDYSEVHRVTCAGCGASPINGLRWKCSTCAGHDICEQCRLGNKSVKPNCTFTLVNLPDEALHIRSPHVDPALVCATLQIMKDWELHVLRTQKLKDPRSFQMSEDLARKGDLGKVTYWKSGDDKEEALQLVKAKSEEKKTGSSKAEKKEKEKAEKEKEKAEKAMAKEKRKQEKEKDKKGAVPGISELIRGSAQVGGSVGDVGEALRRDSRSSIGTR